MPDTTSTPAHQKPISIAQAVLAPLDAIFKAQIHSARSYINMLWQLAYPHLPVDKNGQQQKAEKMHTLSDGSKVYERADGSTFSFNSDGTVNNSAQLTDASISNTTNLNEPYTFPLSFKSAENGNTSNFTVEIPTIAMVPVTPLGVESAEVKFSMSVQETSSNVQMHGLQQTGNEQYGQHKRPWFLVDEPQSLTGHIEASGSTQSCIDIEIKLSKAPIPSALEKALTILSQNINVKPNNNNQ